MVSFCVRLRSQVRSCSLPSRLTALIYLFATRFIVEQFSYIIRTYNAGLIQFNEGRRESRKKALEVGETLHVSRSLHGNDLNSARIEGNCLGGGGGRLVTRIRLVAFCQSYYEVEIANLIQIINHLIRTSRVPCCYFYYTLFLSCYYYKRVG